MSDVGNSNWRRFCYGLSNHGGWCARVAAEIDRSGVMTVAQAAEKVTCFKLRMARGGGYMTVRAIRSAMSAAGYPLKCCHLGGTKYCGAVPSSAEERRPVGEIAELAMHQALGAT